MELIPKENLLKKISNNILCCDLFSQDEKSIFDFLSDGQNYTFDSSIPLIGNITLRNVFDYIVKKEKKEIENKKIYHSDWDFNSKRLHHFTIEGNELTWFLMYAIAEGNQPSQKLQEYIKNIPTNISSIKEFFKFIKQFQYN